MSGIPAGALIGNIVSDIELAMFRPLRAIGSFVAQVTVHEDHVDQLVITQHPIENGAAVTDHAYKMPAQLTIEAGWAADWPVLMGLYSQLLRVQSARMPMTVYTGKRIYPNMLVAQLRTTTDNRYASTLLVQFVLQEIITVSVQKYTAPAQASAAASDHAEPQNTAAPSDQGSQQPTPAQNFNSNAFPPPPPEKPTPPPVSGPGDGVTIPA